MQYSYAGLRLLVFLLFGITYDFIVWLFCLHVCMYLCSQRSEKDVHSPGTGDGCEPRRGWELNPGPL